VHTTMASTLGVTLILVPVLARLGELLIRQRARVRIERARQLAAMNTMLMMRPGSVVVVQQPDGTVSVLWQAPMAEGGPGCGMAHQ
jgi:hypothetical protein